jgi:hypothetical protein
MHLRRARIGETRIDAVGSQGLKKNFRSGKHFIYYRAPVDKVP